MKKRLDLILMEKGLFKSRQAAQGAIMTGRVIVDGRKIEKAGTQVHIGAEIRIIGEEIPYVSRGGLKLEKALKVFTLDFQGKTIMDVGASTGGFTDCALQHGAKEVLAVDVGYGQLAWQLRQDPRVKVLERTNIRYLKPEDIENNLVDIILVDVSFISINLIFEAIYNLSKDIADFVLLIKPQFEVGRGNVGKKGVVKEPNQHLKVINKIINQGQSLGLKVGGLDYSPITGPEGNIEYLLWLVKGKDGIVFDENLIPQVVEKAHQALA